jgi:hypothetical protein
LRQVAGAFMEYDKGRLVAKLRGAHERKPEEPARQRRPVGGRGPEPLKHLLCALASRAHIVQHSETSASSVEASAQASIEPDRHA